ARPRGEGSSEGRRRSRDRFRNRDRRRNRDGRRRKWLRRNRFRRRRRRLGFRFGERLGRKLRQRRQPVSAAAEAPRQPRYRSGAALALTILAIVLAIFAYVLVGLGKKGHVPVQLPLYG